MVTSRSFLVVVGGAGPTALPDELPDGTVVVAADSGLDALVAAGRPVHHVVGDLDSVSPQALATARAAGAVVHAHEPDKDATDLELALDLVAAADADEVLVVGPGGGRLDHLLADLLLLAGPLLAGADVRARFGEARVTVARPGRAVVLDAEVGEQVSLLPAHGPASGVTTKGLRWALVDADLAEGSTRGMSNEVVDRTVSVEVRAGALLLIRPGTAAPPVPSRTSPYDPTPRRTP